MTIHTETLNGLVAGSRFTAALRASKPDWEGDRKGARFGRHLLLDVEPDGAGWSVVFRSADKVLAGASESEARDPEDKRYHRAALYYADEAGKPRPFVLWSTDDPSERPEAEAIAAAVLRFWQSQQDEPEPSFLQRWAAVPAAAQPIVLGLLAAFGPAGPTGRVGTFRRRPRPPKSTPRPIDPRAQAAAEKRAARVLRDRLAEVPPPDEGESDARAQIDALLAEIGLD